MSAYLSGLRVRLFRCGVYVINIKLGYVKTTTNIDAAGDLNLSNNWYLAGIMVIAIDFRSCYNLMHSNIK